MLKSNIFIFVVTFCGRSGKSRLTTRTFSAHLQETSKAKLEEVLLFVGFCLSTFWQTAIFLLILIHGF